jgi:hypothetical protein
VVIARPLFPLPSKNGNEEKKPIQTFRPYNIAHRGSNGEIPEETTAAYLVQLRELLYHKIVYFFLHMDCDTFVNRIHHLMVRFIALTIPNATKLSTDGFCSC